MKSSLSNLYQDKLLAYASKSDMQKRLDKPDKTATAVSKACGSKVTVDIIIKNQLIFAFGQEVEACALGSASSVIVADKIIGKSCNDVKKIRNKMFDMLKKNGQSPIGEWSELALFEPARVLKNRHQSILLVFDAILTAMRK
jgi:NifU-like protein involved in Fe-S cluster formation